MYFLSSFGIYLYGLIKEKLIQYRKENNVIGPLSIQSIAFDYETIQKWKQAVFTFLKIIRHSAFMNNKPNHPNKNVWFSQLGNKAWKICTFSSA